MTRLQSENEIATMKETIQLGPLSIKFLVVGDDSLGSASVFELVVPGGAKLPGPSHSHDAYEETAYGLAGVLTWTVDGQRIEVRPGEAVCIRRGAVHRFDNFTDSEAKALMVASPARIGPEYFLELVEAVSAAKGGPPDQARMAEIMRRHGLTPAMPGA